MAYITQITIPNGNTYSIRDASAQYEIDQIWQYIGGGGSLELVKIPTGQQLPDASSGTMGKIYLLEDDNPSTYNIYEEYITIRNGDEPNYTYTWECIGSTDINLSNYSLKTHTHTVTFGVNVENHTYTPEGDVSVRTSANKVTTVSGTSGTVTYTPAGTVSATFTGNETSINVSGSLNGSATGTVDSSGAHKHTINKSIKYLHYTNVPIITNSSIITSVDSNRLETISIYDLSSGYALASKASSGTSVYIAKPGTEQQFSKIKNNSTGSVSVTLSTSDRATGTLSNEVSIRTANNTNQVMYDASVINNNLFFTLKSMDKSSTAVGVSSATTTATLTDYDNVSITGVNGSISYTPYTFQDVSVPIRLNSKTVATGSVSTNGSGATIITNAQSTSLIGDYATVLNTTIDTSSLNGIQIIQDVSAETDSSGAHIHNVDITGISGTVNSEGTYTPAGTIDATFNGTGVRLVTGNIPVPATFNFIGKESSTLTHTVSVSSGSGTTITTSSAND